jgi:hypothetical protein
MTHGSPFFTGQATRLHDASVLNPAAVAQQGTTAAVPFKTSKGAAD